MNVGMSLKGIKLVTFDVTNTLLKFKMPPWQYYTIVAKDHGYKGTETEIKSRLINNMNVMIKQYPNYGRCSITWEKWWNQLVKMTFAGYLPETADVDRIATKIINDYRTSKCWYLADGGDRLVEYLKNKKLHVGIISNFDPRLYEILQDMSLYNKFDFIATSYDIGYSKPDKRIFNTAIDMCKIEVQPYEALHIGDDIQKDYKGARASGWHALLISPEPKTDITLSPQHVFHSLNMLYATIAQDRLQL